MSNSLHSDRPPTVSFDLREVPTAELLDMLHEFGRPTGRSPARTSTTRTSLTTPPTSTTSAIPSPANWNDAA
jgi:hypothetical protein